MITQSKFVLLGGLFLEVLALIGGVAFFAGRHNEHLNRVQEQLAVIEKSAKASEAALAALRQVEREVADARAETDRKFMEAEGLDGVMYYEFCDRLLREDASRRAAPSASGASGSMR